MTEETKTTEAKDPLDEITDVADSDMPYELTREGILEAEKAAAGELEDEPAATDPEPKPDADEEPKDKEDKEDTKPPAKPKQTAQERINEITAKYRAEQRARESVEAELERYRKGDEPPAADEPADKPQRSDFEDYEDFQEALIDWKAEQKINEREEKARERTQQLREQEQERQEKARAATVLTNGRAKYPDFDQVVNPQLRISTSMVRAIGRADNGGDIVYYLGKNPELSATIARLNPLETALEIGRLSVEIMGAAAIPPATDTPAAEPGIDLVSEEPKPAPEPTPKPVSRAPKPPARLPPGKPMVPEVDPDKFSTQAEFETWYFKKLGY